MSDPMPDPQTRAHPHHRPADAMVHPRFEGIRTFMRLPHLSDPHRWSEADLAIVGVPFDSSGTYRVGARFGPSGIRHESMLLRPYHPELRVDVHERLSMIDAGDLPVTPGYLPESHAQITEGAGTVLDAGVVPIFLGGDHSVSLPLLRAVAQRHGPVGLVHLDAHADLWPGYFGGKDTHGTPFRRAVEENLIDPARSVQVGLRGPVYGPGDMSLPEELGLAAISADRWHRVGTDAVIQEVRERIGADADGRTPGPTYLSFDIDVLDPVYAPGTGTPEVGGTTGVQALQLLRGLAGVRFCAYDLVEVMPAYDAGAVTQLLAANLAYEMIALSAVATQRSEA
ncbi:MAG: agmatinase [Trueperaceae bacterium]